MSVMHCAEATFVNINSYLVARIGSFDTTGLHVHLVSVTVSHINFFSVWVFFHDHSRLTGLREKEEGISLTPQYRFHPLHRHLDISQTITAGSSPLHIASSRTRTGNLWFPSASR